MWETNDSKAWRIVGWCMAVMPFVAIAAFAYGIFTRWL